MNVFARAPKKFPFPAFVWSTLKRTRETGITVVRNALRPCRIIRYTPPCVAFQRQPKQR
ncbi:hypothetical protein Agau_L100325 [Agrobacterium tumefaciens F2]|nr:hypothetical protein Agau_L100325 [Agrobacterium tumefaciens F2]